MPTRSFIILIAIVASLTRADLSAVADCPCLTVGASLTTISVSEQIPRYLVPGWGSVRIPIRAPWTASARIDREHLPIDIICVTSGDCPRVHADVVPVRIGIRLAPSARGSLDPFLDVAPTLTWVRITEDWTQSADRHSDHWLVGAEAGAGIAQSWRRLGWEFGVHYGYRGRARRTNTSDFGPITAFSISGAVVFGLGRSAN
jgi:hypothetical protein